MRGEITKGPRRERERERGVRRAVNFGSFTAVGTQKPSSCCYSEVEARYTLYKNVETTGEFK